MNVTLSPDMAERIEKLRTVIRSMGFEISPQELVERTLEDGLEVSVYRLGLALREPEEIPLAP
jgi:hypothetical protein